MKHRYKFEFVVIHFSQLIFLRFLFIYYAFICLFCCIQVAGHHTAKLDPLGISSADLDSKVPPALQLAKYSFG